MQSGEFAPKGSLSEAGDAQCLKSEVAAGCLERSKLDELDRAFRLTRSGNSEVSFQWLMMSIRNRYEPAYPRLEEFLTTIGRRKFIKPLYEEMAKTPEGRERALGVYRRARASYHPIAVASIDPILKWQTRRSAPAGAS